MPKHFLVITESVPNLYHGGGGITAYAAIEAFLRANHRVSLISFSSLGNDDQASALQLKQIAHFKERGVAVYLIEKKLHTQAPSRLNFNRYFPKREALFSGITLQPQVKQYVEKLNPDALFMYHWDAIASAYGLRMKPKLGLVGDPIHLPHLLRKEFNQRTQSANLNSDISKKVKSWIKSIFLERAQITQMKKYMNELLLDCHASGAFAAHHAEEFFESGVKHCLYYRTPVPNPALKNKHESNKFKILHIGHLKGIATLSGIELLAKEIIPQLKSLLPKDSFEVHLVGGFYESVPVSLKNLLNDPTVKIRGHISPADEEFLSADVVLVPTPIELGIRVRILTAFSYGCCVVAHSANKKGIPELTHEQNSLLGNSAPELALACARVFNNPQLGEQLSTQAYATHGNFFSIEAAGNTICEKMVELECFAK